MDTNDLINSLGEILKDQDGQNKLAGLSRMFGDNQESNHSSSKKDDMFSEEIFSYMGRMMQSFNRHDNRIDLLNSIRPYLKDKRVGNVDMAIRIIRLMNLARDFNFKDVKNVSDI